MTVRGALVGLGAGLVAAGSVLVAAGAGCGGPKDQPVTVRVQASDQSGKVVPIAGAEFTLLPFDIDSVYKALEQKNQAGPEPQPDSLEALFNEFTRADTSLPDADSALMERQTALEGIKDRTSDEYRQAFTDYQAAQKARDSLSAARDSLQARFSPAREAYNRARTTWEGTAWDGFDPIQKKLYSQVSAPKDSAGKEATWKQKTNESGSFKVWVPPGRWWLAGRFGVPGSVHEVYRWNVPLTVDGSPVTLEITGDQAKRLKTY